MLKCLNLVLAEFVMFDELIYPITCLFYLIIIYMDLVSLYNCSLPIYRLLHLIYIIIALTNKTL